MIRRPIVYIVFCMDTEGPCADPHDPSLLGSWDRVDRAMDALFTPALRAAQPDSAGGALKIGWFFLTWTGFVTNPRQRALGYHAVRDHYLARWAAALDAYGDEHAWHYHQPPASGVANEWGLDWTTSREYAAIISREILDRGWFPACYRAGGTIMGPAASRWIDAWFPIDYTNRAPLHVPGIADWSTGRAQWDLYHPDPEDVRRPGPGRRRMARCLDLVTGVHRLAADDVAQAFDTARREGAAILSVFDHDYRDIHDRVLAFMQLVAEAGRQHPDVAWQYAAPAEAVRRYAGMTDSPAPQLRIVPSSTSTAIEITANVPIFQSVPWIAARDSDGRVHHVEEGILRLDATHWRWRPSPDLRWVDAAFACSTDAGLSAVARLASGRAATGRIAGHIAAAAEEQPPAAAATH